MSPRRKTTREQIAELLASTDRPANPGRAVAALRRNAVVQAYQSLRAEQTGEVGVSVRGLRIHRLEAIEDGVEIWLSDRGDGPDFRIVNPPTLVPDPSGDVEVHGKRWREDPLGAVAQVILDTRKPSETRRRRRSR